MSKENHWSLPLETSGRPEGIYYSAKFLQEYLYGQRQSREGNTYVYTPIQEHVYRDRKKPSGFFSLPDSGNISAVLFSDGGTISKFHRMGKLAGFGNQDVKMLRVGQRYETSQSPDVTVFRVKVDPPGYAETWSEGIYVFHNPRAKYPLSPQLFPDASHTFLTNGQYAISVPDRFPIWSKDNHPFRRAENTMIFVDTIWHLRLFGMIQPNGDLNPCLNTIPTSPYFPPDWKTYLR